MRRSTEITQSGHIAGWPSLLGRSSPGIDGRSDRSRGGCALIEVVECRKVVFALQRHEGGIVLEILACTLHVRIDGDDCFSIGVSGVWGRLKEETVAMTEMFMHIKVLNGILESSGVRNNSL